MCRCICKLLSESPPGLNCSVGPVVSLNWVREEGASSDCLAASNACQAKKRAKDREKRRAPLLSRGPHLPIMLSTCWQVGCHSVCLATQLPSSLSPCLQQPITFQPALLLLTPCCGDEAPRTSGQTEETNEKEYKEDTEIRWRKLWLRLWFWKQFNMTRWMMKKLSDLSWGVEWVKYDHLVGLLQQEFLRASLPLPKWWRLFLEIHV